MPSTWIEGIKKRCIPLLVGSGNGKSALNDRCGEKTRRNREINSKEREREKETIGGPYGANRVSKPGAY